jgi:hypothetical protein
MLTTFQTTCVASKENAVYSKIVIFFEVQIFFWCANTFYPQPNPNYVFFYFELNSSERGKGVDENLQTGKREQNPFMQFYYFGRQQFFLNFVWICIWSWSVLLQKYIFRSGLSCKTLEFLPYLYIWIVL